MRLGAKCEIEDIKIGEIFAINSFGKKFEIMTRVSKIHFMELTYTGTVHFGGHIWKHLCGEDFYKLTKATQRLWKEE